MSTETTVQNLKINKLTKAQFDTITPSATEAYELTDLSSILDGKQNALTSANAGNCIEITRSVLPSGYQELEYVETTGTQYINTGIIPTVAKTTEFRLTIARTSGSTPEGFGTNSNLNIVNVNSTLWRFNGVQTNVSIVNNQFENITLKQTSSGRYYKIGSTEGYGSSSAVSGYFYIGALYGDTNYKLKCKIKSSVCLENNAIIQNLIPAKRLSDNAIGMYDTVTDTFFTNAGTGIFTAGAEIGGNLAINFVNNAGYITNSAIANMQTTSNLVTSVSASSTDAQYPSAKLFYDTVGNIESALNTINSGS